MADSEVRLLRTIALMGSEKSSEADESTLARKAAKYGRRCPYRKPTQVDEMNFYTIETPRVAQELVLQD